MRSIIDPAQDLVGSEAMSMVIRMSLQSKLDRTRLGVPRVQDVDALVNSIFVLPSFQTVVFDVVDGFKVHSAPEGVCQLVFNGAPSQKNINGGKDTRMKQQEPGIFVEEYHDWQSYVISMSFLNSFVLALPSLEMLSEE